MGYSGATLRNYPCPYVLPLAAVCAVSALFASPANAQPRPGGGNEQIQREARLRELERYELDTRYRANEAVPPGQRTLIDYGAFIQGNYLSLDDTTHSNRGVREFDFIPFARINFDGAQELFIRGRIGYRDFNPGDSFDGRGDEPVDGDLDRGYYRFDAARYNAAYGGNVLGAGANFNFVFQGGRDLVYWGNGLVMGTTIDGVIVDVTAGIIGVQVIAGITPIGTVDFDTSRPGFDYNTRRGFYGAKVTANLGDHQPYVYGLVQQDYNKMDELELGFIDTKYEYNSYYIGIGASAALTDHLRYGVEFAYEGGESLSNSFEASGAGGLFPVNQTRDPIQALGFDARFDYFLNNVRQSRFSAELLITSGDPDRGSSTNTFNGNKPRTDDRSFNAFGLINTGLAFSPDPSNISAVRLGYATQPFADGPQFLRRFQIGVDFFILSKTQADAPIDIQTLDVHYLGLEPDIYVNWQITSDVTLALRYGAFFPSDRAFGQNDDVRQFFFAGLTFAF